MKTIITADIVIAIAVLFAVGCSKAKNSERAKESPAPAAKQQEINDFKQLGLIYHNYLDANKDQPPTGADDFIKFSANNQQLLQVLQKVKSGQYVIIWGLKKMDLIKNASSIVGYEKDAQTTGGAVMMGSGQGKYLTAAEFQSTPKASGK